jgi:DNA-binding TFAR19-related protein (PDSD5 family)
MAPPDLSRVDMQITQAIFPLADALQRVEEQLQQLAQTGQVSLQEFT